MGEVTDEEDDVALVRRVAQNRDLVAFAELIRRWTPKVTRHLLSQFEHQLDRCEIDQAVNDAAQNVWRSAKSFDPERGKFRSWLLTIAHRTALDIIDSEKKHVAEGMEFFDPKDPLSDECDDDSENQSVDEWRVQQMDDIIENELKGFEQIVAKADSSVGGSADSAWLAEKYGKTKNTVQVTRSKVRKKIMNLILEREANLKSTKGSK